MKRHRSAARSAIWLLGCLVIGLAPARAQVISLAFASATDSMDEQTQLAIDVVRTGDLGEVGVDIQVAGGSAVSGVDYQLSTPGGACGKDVCFSASDLVQTVFVQGFDDELAEGDETLALQLANGFAPAATVTLAAPSTTVIDLLDSGVCEFELDTFPGSEELAEIFVTVLRAGGSAGSKECQLDTLDGGPPNGAVAPDDYAAVAGALLSWGSGDDSRRTVTIDVVDDDEPEELETFELQLSLPVVPAASAGRRESGVTLPAILDSVVATIADNDVSSRFSFVDRLIETKEVDGRAEIAIERTGDVTKAASVDVVLGIGAAKEGLDFEIPDKTARWAAGEGGVETVTVELLRDDLQELTEVVVISLGPPRESPVGAPFPLLGEITETVLTIEDFSATRQVRFTANLFAGFELDGETAVVLERTGTAAGRVSVSLCQGPGSTATPADFTILEPTASWSDGETGTKSLAIRIANDREVEDTELIDLFLCSPIGAELDVPDAATVAIADDDVAVGPETEIAAATEVPEHPAVAYDGAGRKIVVWQAPDGDGDGIFARLFDRTGAALGSTFRVNPEIAGDQTDPSVAFDDRGAFLVAYRERASAARLAPVAAASTGIVARAFDPLGQATGGGTVTNSSTAGEPSVSSDKDGETTVAWEDAGRTRGRRLDSQGRATGAEIEIDQSEGCRPEVATAASGEFVVVWIAGSCADGPDGGRTASATRAEGLVSMRRFDDRGGAVGPPVEVARGAGIATAAAAVDDQGRAAVVWEAESSAGDLDVFARLYGADGNALGPAFVVNQGRVGDQSSPQVDANAVFDLAFVWLDDTPAIVGPATVAGNGVTLRLFDGSGRPTSGDVAVTTADAVVEAARPDVSIENRDQTTVVWERRRRDDGASLGIASSVLEPRIADGSCTPTETDLCLNRSRFQVQVEWQAFDGTGGSGSAELLTSETGYYWFFDQGNVEVVLKVLDGCAINQHFWVFAAGLTNVEVNLRVDDALSGRSVAYFSTLGKGFEPILDVTALPSCDLRLPALRTPEP